GGARRRGGVRGRERLVDGLVEAGVTATLRETGVPLLAVAHLVGELVGVIERLVECAGALLELLEALHLGARCSPVLALHVLPPYPLAASPPRRPRRQDPRLDVET